jgi:hypothetical protein
VALKTVTNVTPAQLIAQFDAWVRVHIQVRDANIVYLSTNRPDLEVLGQGGQQGGLAIDKNAGIVSIPWIGPLYALGSAPNVQVEFALFSPGVDIGR